jgi:hypothetical protein
MFRRLVLPLLPLCLPGCGWVVGDLPEPYEANVTDASVDTSAADRGDVDIQHDALESGHAEAEAMAEATAEAMPEAMAEAGVDGPEETSVDSAACDPCDCDHDGYLAEACAGDDCDDEDGRVHPDQQKYFDTASPTVGFDFDCSTTTDRDPALNVVVQCAGLSLLACEQALQGFIGAMPACGEVGDWGTCRANGLVCEPDIYEQRRMRCH